jgi:delta(3,5)-delta(2,4)-dienoyl-CoA isomerase
MTHSTDFHEPHATLSSLFSTLNLYIPGRNRHVVVVELNRPQKRNAINSTMWRELGEAFSMLGRIGDGCRVVILKGAGEGFSSGLDLSDPSFFPSTASDDPARNGIAFSSKIKEMQRSFTAIEDCPVPVIALLDGLCIGAGIDLASACDIRLCSLTSKFSVREVKLGLAADVGTLQRLPKVTGNDSRVRELCYTGEFFGADEALRIGFVSRISKNLMEDALKLASLISSNSPVAVYGTKRSLLYSRDHTVHEGLEMIATHNSLALLTSDIAIGGGKKKQITQSSYHNMPRFAKL